jgi:outer membrane lipoprotein
MNRTILFSKHSIRFLGLVLATGLLFGCASAPTPLQGDFQQPSAQAMRDGQTGNAPLRAGGEIIATEPGRDSTCFEVLQHPLDASARPRSEHDGGDRFLACREGFYDPAVFEPGREITVIGRFDRLVEREIGEYLYTFPQIRADVVYLWPLRREPRYDSFYHIGFGYPFHFPYYSRLGFGLRYRVPLGGKSEDEKSPPPPPSEQK